MGGEGSIINIRGIIAGFLASNGFFDAKFGLGVFGGGIGGIFE